MVDLPPIPFEVDDETFLVEAERATVLGEGLRRAAAGEFGDQGYEAAALAVADAIEDVLVGRSDGPVVLDDDEAEAVFYHLNVAGSPTGPEYDLYAAVRQVHYRLEEL